MHSKLVEEIERHILSEFIGQRILDRARDKQEPIHLAKRISQGFFNELKSLSIDFYKAKLFIEAFCMLHEIEKKGLS